MGMVVHLPVNLNFVVMDWSIHEHEKSVIPDVGVMMGRIVPKILGYVLDNVPRVSKNDVLLIVPMAIVEIYLSIVIEQIIVLMIAMMNSVIQANFAQMAFLVATMRHCVREHVKYHLLRRVLNIASRRIVVMDMLILMG